MNTNRHTPTPIEILMIAQANPDVGVPTLSPRAKPRRRRDREHEEQVKLIDWAGQNLYKWDVEPEELFAIPNGGKRSKATGGKLKAEGLRSGIPDLMLAVPMGQYPGLFIEMKVVGNRPRKKQVECAHRLRKRGYRVVVAYSAAEAIGWLELYLDNKLPLDK